MTSEDMVVVVVVLVCAGGPAARGLAPACARRDRAKQVIMAALGRAGHVVLREDPGSFEVTR